MRRMRLAAVLFAMSAIASLASCTTTLKPPAATATPSSAAAGPFSTAVAGGPALSASPEPGITGTPVVISIDCWNASGCILCYTSAYDCIGSPLWQPSCSFADPCPAGLVVKQIAARVFGGTCSSSPSFTMTVGGTVVGSYGNGGLTCSCGQCVQIARLSPYFASGFPGYVSGGSNTFAFTQTDGILCVSWVDLTFGCE